jgi:hypothetical protein
MAKFSSRRDSIRQWDRSRRFRRNGPIDKMNRSDRSIHKTHWTPLTSENLSVPKPEPEPLHLRRIDAARDMRRFYALSTRPTLFSEMSLIRNWGRIGMNGKTMAVDLRWSCGGDRSIGAPGACQAEARLRCHGRKTFLICQIFEEYGSAPRCRLYLFHGLGVRRAKSKQWELVP